MSRLSYLWIVTASVAFLFSSIFVINALKIEFFALVRGQGLVLFPIDFVIFGRGIDLLILVTSLGLTTAGLISLYFGRVKLTRKDIFLILPVTLFLISIVEVGSSVRWITAGLTGEVPFSDSSWRLSMLDMQFANILYPWLPRIMLIFLFSWILRALYPYYQGILAQVISPIRVRVFAQSRPILEKSQGIHISNKVMLLLGLIFAILVSAYPYLPGVNPEGRLVGVDTPFYLEKLEEGIVSNPLAVALGTDRTLLHLLGSGLNLILANPELVLKVLPALLSVLLVVSTFILVKTTARSSSIAGLAALFTPIAFQEIIGINAGFFANWLALIEMNIFFTFLLKAFRGKRLWIFGSLITSILILFTHPWTWFVVLFSLSLFLLIGLFTRKSSRTEVFLISGLLATNILADFLRGFAFPFLQRGVVATSSSLLPGFALADLPSIFGVLEATFNIFLGGALHNSALILLSLVGFIAIKDYGNRFNRILLSLGITVLVGVFLFSSDFDAFLQARALYVLPFGIFAAIGFSTVANSIRGFAHRIGIPRSYPLVFTTLLMVTLTLSMLNHALRMASTIFPFLG